MREATYIELIGYGRTDVRACSFQRRMARRAKKEIRLSFRMETHASQFSTKLSIETSEYEEVHLKSTRRQSLNEASGSYGTVQKDQEIRDIVTDVQQRMISMVHVDIIENGRRHLAKDKQGNQTDHRSSNDTVSVTYSIRFTSETSTLPIGRRAMLKEIRTRVDTSNQFDVEIGQHQ